mmetsp:Transcript_18767/g.45267  ORF Transcript_18767/g.45267 Transcript_18767/m.45267 type:complete len:319 (+) Transcript_18767:68-1024(+)
MSGTVRVMPGGSATGVVAFVLRKFGAVVVGLIAVWLARRALATRTDLRGRIVLVTGAGGGLGRALAKKLAQKGAQLALWDLNKEALEETASLCREAGANVFADVVNVSDRTTVYEAAIRVLEFGTVYGVVNNAGIVSGQYLHEIPDSRIEASFRVNVMAHFWIVKALLPDMERIGEGHIVTISSMAGIIAVPKQVDYAATKFAARGFSEGLRAELAFRGVTGVRTTCVCPGAIATNLFKGFSVPFIPAMTTDFVATAVVDCLESGREFIILPSVAILGAISNGVLPYCLTDVFNSLGARSMQGFDGSHARNVFRMMGE